MNILVLGDETRANELLKRIPKTIEVRHSSNPNDASLPKHDVVFDLNFDDSPTNLQYYSYVKGKVVLAGMVKNQLAAVLSNLHHQPRCEFMGINALPTFIDRDLLEVTLCSPEQEEVLKSLCEALGWQYKIVQDRVGMVTPRIVLMIINEACYTLQEGTASIEDIDLGMKLGTNYPKGPFEWADAIGIKNVYETLEALYQDTHDERYKICPLLKTKYLRQEAFH